jgi:hypothetical protein
MDGTVSELCLVMSADAVSVESSSSVTRGPANRLVIYVDRDLINDLNKNYDRFWL